MPLAKQHHLGPNDTTHRSKRRTSPTTPAELVDTQYDEEDEVIDFDAEVLNEMEGVLHEKASRHLNRLQEYVQALRDITTTTRRMDSRIDGGVTPAHHQVAEGRRPRSPWMPKGPWYGGQSRSQQQQPSTDNNSADHSPYCCPCVLCTCWCHGGTRGGGDVSVPRTQQNVRQPSTGRSSSSQQWSPPPPLRGGRAQSTQSHPTLSSSSHHHHPTSSRRVASLEAAAALLLGRGDGDSPLRLTGDHRANTLRLLRRWMRKRGEGGGDDSGYDEDTYRPRHAKPRRAFNTSTQRKAESTPPVRATQHRQQPRGPTPHRRTSEQVPPHTTASGVVLAATRPIPPGLNRSVPQPLSQYYSDEEEGYEEEWDTDDDALLSSETPEWSSPPVADVTPLRPPQLNKSAASRSNHNHRDPQSGSKRAPPQQQNLQRARIDSSTTLDGISHPAKQIQYRPHRGAKGEQHPATTSAPRHPSISPYDEEGGEQYADGVSRNPNVHRGDEMDDKDEDRAGSTHLSETTSFVSEGSVTPEDDQDEEEEYEEEEEDTPTVRGSAPIAAASKPHSRGSSGREVLMTMGSPVGKGAVVDTSAIKSHKRRVNPTEAGLVQQQHQSGDDSEELRSRLAALEAALYGHTRRPSSTTITGAPLTSSTANGTRHHQRIPTNDDGKSKRGNSDGDQRGGSERRSNHQEAEKEVDGESDWDEDVSQTSMLEESDEEEDGGGGSTPKYEEGAMPNSQEVPNPQAHTGHLPQSSNGSSRYWQLPSPSAHPEDFAERHQRRAQKRQGVASKATTMTTTDILVEREDAHHYHPPQRSSSSITGPMSSPYAPLVMPFSQQAPPSINHSTMSSQTGTLLPNPYTKSATRAAAAAPMTTASTASQPPSSANTSFSVVYGTATQYTSAKNNDNNTNSSMTADLTSGRGGRISHMATPNLTPIVKRGGNNNKIRAAHSPTQGGGNGSVLEESEMSIQESWMSHNNINNNGDSGTTSRGIQFTQVTAKYSPGRAYTTVFRQPSSSPIRETTTTTTTTSSSKRRFRAVTSTSMDVDDDAIEVGHNQQQPPESKTNNPHTYSQRPLSHQYDDDEEGGNDEYGIPPIQGEEEANFVSLGLTLSNRREQLGLPGVHVHRVAPNSPADLVGLRPNDIIVEWNPSEEGRDSGQQGGVFQVHRLAHIEELVQMQTTGGVSELEIVFLDHLKVHPSLLEGPPISPNPHNTSSSVVYTVGNPDTNRSTSATSSSHPHTGYKKDGSSASRIHAARRGVITIEGGSLYPTARNKRREPYCLPGVTQPRHECPHEEHPFHPQCRNKYRSPSTTSSAQRR